MKSFDCDVCRLKIKPQDALVRWHYERPVRSASFLQIVHNKPPCNLKGKEDFFNRGLALEYVFKNMPEFIVYIKRLNIREKELKDFVHRIEKDRSYIRRHNVDRAEVKKMIIRMDGTED